MWVQSRQRGKQQHAGVFVTAELAMGLPGSNMVGAAQSADQAAALQEQAVSKSLSAERRCDGKGQLCRV